MQRHNQNLAEHLLIKFKGEKKEVAIIVNLYKVLST